MSHSIPKLACTTNIIVLDYRWFPITLPTNSSYRRGQFPSVQLKRVEQGRRYAVQECGFPEECSKQQTYYLLRSFPRPSVQQRAILCHQPPTTPWNRALTTAKMENQMHRAVQGLCQMQNSLNLVSWNGMTVSRSGRQSWFPCVHGCWSTTTTPGLSPQPWSIDASKLETWTLISAFTSSKACSLRNTRIVPELTCKSSVSSLRVASQKMKLHGSGDALMPAFLPGTSYCRKPPNSCGMNCRQIMDSLKSMPLSSEIGFWQASDGLAWGRSFTSVCESWPTTDVFSSEGGWKQHVTGRRRRERERRSAREDEPRESRTEGLVGVPVGKKARRGGYVRALPNNNRRCKRSTKSLALHSRCDGTCQKPEEVNMFVQPFIFICHLTHYILRLAYGMQLSHEVQCEWQPFHADKSQRSDRCMRRCSIWALQAENYRPQEHNKGIDHHPHQTRSRDPTPHGREDVEDPLHSGTRPGPKSGLYSSRTLPRRFWSMWFLSTWATWGRTEGVRVSTLPGGVEGAAKQTHYAPLHAAKHSGRQWVSVPIQRSRNRQSKRSFRRACTRAQLHGGTMYRGRWRTCKELCGTDSHPNHTNEAKLQERGAPHWKVMTWNAGGLHAGLYSEVLTYMHDFNVDIGMIQETKWKFTSTWSSQQYHMIHSGGTQEHAKHGGVLILISKRVAQASSIQYNSMADGRLLHVRFAYKATHVDLINTYQFAINNSSGLFERRHSIWVKLAQCISRVPQRNVLIAAGDYNATCTALGGHSGNQVLSHDASKVVDQDEFMQIIRANDMIALNTWRKGPLATYTWGQAKSQIDYILIRRTQATPLSKMAKARSSVDGGRMETRSQAPSCICSGADKVDTVAKCGTHSTSTCCCRQNQDDTGNAQLNNG